ncbi:YggS family pyridoxal phosphate-dependent enzyme [Paenibacillus koleovorans]|uniref:YggS family pyridoxal phosphate-dependent enzyme n=1 Tax=Paenibacillus koleovorans TaxID=121608 RepID=UPI000FD9D21C|nr:YggS family pyridoxal phosphate-dependent enzyme [Paenibacillus koleovorans]
MSLTPMEVRIQNVEEHIAAACRRSGRSRSDVQAIAVTKYVSLETTRLAMQLGLLHIGENRWQDVQPKWEALGASGVWHFIGHLQTNKVKDVIGKFEYIHSLDRLSLATELERQAAKRGIDRVQCLIQLNVSGEETKYGMAPDRLLEFAEQLREMPRLHVAGLMTMAPYEMEAEHTRPVFRALREWRDKLNASGILKEAAPHLSMGMSNDFEVAIEEGATMVRLGTVLVGKEITEEE